MSTRYFAFLPAILGSLLMLLAASPSFAEATPDDRAALQNLKDGRAVFDITLDDPKKLLLRLKLIEETADMLRKEGVKPDFVLAFRGPATLYVSSDRSRIKLEDQKIADQIADKIKEMSGQPGVRLEQCAVAARVLKVDTKTINPAVTVVGNSWISLIGYQNRGYAFVPVD